MLPHAGRPPLHHGKVQQEHEGGGAVQQDRGERGMSKQLLERCDEVWVFDENGTSEGMKGEIELASQLGKQVRYR